MDMSFKTCSKRRPDLKPFCRMRGPMAGLVTLERATVASFLRGARFRMVGATVTTRGYSVRAMVKPWWKPPGRFWEANFRKFWEFSRPGPMAQFSPISSIFLSVSVSFCFFLFLFLVESILHLFCHRGTWYSLHRPRLWFSSDASCAVSFLAPRKTARRFKTAIHSQSIANP